MDLFNYTFSEADRLAKCAEVNKLNSSIQCQWVRNNDECNDFGGLFNYAHLFYCTIGAHSSVGPLLVSAVFLFIYFIGLGVTADDFLCPSLLVISKTLKLSQNVAGVTFLAFGNGAPDIFSSIAGVKSAKPDLVLGELFGAGIFVITIVAGSVMLVKPFKSMERPILRDILFYILATFLTWLIFYNERIKLWEAIVFILIYVVYIIVVVVGRMINNRWKNSAMNVERIGQSNKLIDRQLSIDSVSSKVSGRDNLAFSYGTEEIRRAKGSTNQLTVPGFTAPAESLDIKRGSLQNTPTGRDGVLASSYESRPRTMSHPRYLVHNHFNNALFSITHNRNEDESCNDINCLGLSGDQEFSFYRSGSENQGKGMTSSVRSSMRSRSTSVNPRKLSFGGMSQISQESLLNELPEWQDFLIHVCPIDYINWPELSLFSKIFQVIKAPLYFLFIITIPVVDYESHKNNWCRWLNCIHCVTGPLAIMAVVGVITESVNGFPIAVIVALVGILAALVVYFTSSYNDAPKYQWLFGYLGFVVSVVWIYGLANEVVDLLQAIGIMFNLSDSILGLTVLAWGNSLGDLISNISMARQGFPRMSISACFGGPLLNLLLGIGLPYTVLLSDEGKALFLEYTRMTSLLYGTVTFALMLTVILFVMSGFEAKRSHGIFLISIYFLYMVFAVLIEMDIM